MHKLRGTVVSGTIAKFSKSVGDFVKVDERFAVLIVDNTSCDLIATHGGVIEEIYVKNGDTFILGNPLFRYQSDGKQT